MPAKTLMVQGTASSVGKSILVAALCRIFKQDGYRVAPFKAQNMSNNSFVTPEGGEIGRAQAVQAEACGIEPSVHFNPILLKPEADNRSQVILLGKVFKTSDAREYYKNTKYFLNIIKDSLNLLSSQYDLIVIEGAGSPAEINLKDTEVVNMRVARLFQTPVLLVGDIDRGGVFASLIGTLSLLDKAEQGLVRGIIINKFRGDVQLLKPGIDMLEKISRKPVLGIIPYFKDINVAQEDAVYLENKNLTTSNGGLSIAIIHLPRISNFDDFDPLEQPGCQVHYIKNVSQLDNADLIIIPGTKSTIADLNYMRQQGLDAAITRKVKSGTPIIGICGGYQMLGNSIADPEHIESDQNTVEGLGLLDTTTEYQPYKTTKQVTARITASYGLLKGLDNLDINGYEIHMGFTQRKKCVSPFQILHSPDGISPHPDGAIDNSGYIMGTYIHGLFHNSEFTTALIKTLGEIHQLPVKNNVFLNKDNEYDKLAALIRQNLDISQIYKITMGREQL